MRHIGEQRGRWHTVGARIVCVGVLVTMPSVSEAQTASGTTEAGTFAKRHRTDLPSATVRSVTARTVWRRCRC